MIYEREKKTHIPKNSTRVENYKRRKQARTGANLITTLNKLSIGEDKAAQATSHITHYGEEASKILAEA